MKEAKDLYKEKYNERRPYKIDGHPMLMYQKANMKMATLDWKKPIHSMQCP
jgi:hypothetical protein